jgi:hypothetical protein
MGFSSPKRHESSKPRKHHDIVFIRINFHLQKLLEKKTDSDFTSRGKPIYEYDDIVYSETHGRVYVLNVTPVAVTIQPAR